MRRPIQAHVVENNFAKHLSLLFYLVGGHFFAGPILCHELSDLLVNLEQQLN